MSGDPSPGSRSTRHEILVADDHELVLQGIKAVLETVPEWHVCGVAPDGRTAVELARRLHPDVAVLDLAMPGLNGVEATRQIRRNASPNTEVLVLTGTDSDELFAEVVAVGVRAFVLKSDDALALIAGVRALTEGRPYLSPGVRRPLRDIARGSSPAPAPRRDNLGAVQEESLTPREREIAQLLVEGKSNHAIATLLAISVKTVETHRAHIMDKIGCCTIVDLVRYAVRHLIVAP